MNNPLDWGVLGQYLLTADLKMIEQIFAGLPVERRTELMNAMVEADTREALKLDSMTVEVGGFLLGLPGGHKIEIIHGGEPNSIIITTRTHGAYLAIAHFPTTERLEIMSALPLKEKVHPILEE